MMYKNYVWHIDAVEEGGLQQLGEFQQHGGVTKQCGRDRMQHAGREGGHHRHPNLSP